MAQPPLEIIGSMGDKIISGTKLLVYTMRASHRLYPGFSQWRDTGRMFPVSIPTPGSDLDRLQSSKNTGRSAAKFRQVCTI